MPMSPLDGSTGVPVGEPPAKPAKAKRERKAKVKAVVPADHPYTPLGYDHGTFYYLSHAARQVIALSTSAHTINNLLQLAPLDYWQAMYPTGGKVPVEQAANYLFNRCYAAGIYDPTKIRGRGAWWDDGRSVVHVGAHLIVDGEIQDIATFDTRYVYEAGKAIEVDLNVALPAKEAVKFGQFMSKLTWTDPADARLASGFPVIALGAGAYDWHPHAWISARAGSGKAQPHSAKVLTRNGWKRMGELKVGEQIRTPDNGHAFIRAIYPQGKVPVYKLTFTDGRITRATADHLWKVRLNNQWRLRTTADMIKVLSNPDTPNAERLAIQVPEALAISEQHEINLPIHPYVLGVLLGDGHMANAGMKDGKGKAGTITVTTTDEWLLEKIKKLAPNGTTFYPTNSPLTFRFGGLQRFARVVRPLIKDLRLLGTRSHTKFIPSQYLNASIQERTELLQGLMDTDGTIGVGGNLSYCTTSPQMAEDFCYLVRSLGGVARISPKKPFYYADDGARVEGKPAYIIGIRLPNRACAFTLPRKLERAAKEYQYADCIRLGVETIELDGEEECSCIAIDHPDRLYVTDDFVVTHNTWLMDKVYSELLLGFAVECKSAVTTEPGIRRTLMGSSLPVMLDDPDGAAQMNKIIELMRACSQSGRAKARQGGGDGGGAVEFDLLSCFICSSVLVPFTNEADVGRITVLTLDNSHMTQQEAEEHFFNLQKERAALLTEKYRLGFQARALKMIPVIRATVEPMTIAATRVYGSRRSGDQIGTLLAGAWSLRSDKVPTIEEAIAWIAERDISNKSQVERASDEVVCMRTIAQSVLQLDGGNRRRVDELVRAALWVPPEDGIALTDEEKAADQYRRLAIATLRRNGILVADRDWVMVSNSDAGIKRMLSRTAWEQNWARLLERVKGADKRDPTWFVRSGAGAAKTRSVAIPVPVFLGESEREPGED